MGVYFNPDNESFTIEVSHARRFGKSHAAGMIDAYYSCGSDSYELFKDTEIAKKDIGLVWKKCKEMRYKNAQFQ